MLTFNSLQFLNVADMRAMAIYLKSFGEGNPPAIVASPIPAPESSLLLRFG